MLEILDRGGGLTPRHRFRQLVPSWLRRGQTTSLSASAREKWAVREALGGISEVVQTQWAEGRARASNEQAKLHLGVRYRRCRCSSRSRQRREVQSSGAGPDGAQVRSGRVGQVVWWELGSSLLGGIEEPECGTCPGREL